MRTPRVIAKPVEIGKYAPVAASLMTPVTLVAYVMAMWRLGADLNWLGEFFISTGLLSKWPVWLALALATQALSHQLNRASRRDTTVTT